MEELTTKQIEKRALKIISHFDAGFYEDFLYASKAKRYASQAVSYAYSNDLQQARILMMQAEAAWKQAGGKSHGRRCRH
jgi:hypothetical protein